MALKDDRVEQCLRSCGSQFQMWGPKQRESAKATSLAFVLLDFLINMHAVSPFLLVSRFSLAVKR